jgi:hypothetical protein
MSKRSKFLTDDPTPRNVKKAGLKRTRIRGFAGLLDKVFPRKFIIDVPDKADTTWREEGRKQKTVKKTIDYKQGTILNSVDRQAVINSIMKSGDPNSGNDFNILGLELMKALPSMDAAVSMKRNRPSEFNTIARAIRGLKFIDTWKNIFPQRFLSKEFVEKNATSVLMYLIGTASHPLDTENLVLNVAGEPMDLRFLPEIGALMGDHGYTLDIAKKQILPRKEFSVIKDVDEIWNDMKKDGLKKKTTNIKEFAKRWLDANKFALGAPIPEPDAPEERIVDLPVEGEEIPLEEISLEKGELGLEPIEEEFLDEPKKKKIAPGVKPLSENVLKKFKDLLKTGLATEFLDREVIRDVIDKGGIGPGMRKNVLEIVNKFFD